MGIITGMLNAGVTLFSPAAVASTANRPLVSGSGNATSFGNRLLYPTAQSDNYNAAVGDLVIMTTAGTSKTVTLPASPATGDRVGVRYKAQTAGDTVTIAPNGKDIEGVAAASVDLKLYVADDTSGQHDYVELVYDGTEWWLDADHRVKHSVELNLTTAEDGETAATWTKCPRSGGTGVWTVQKDYGPMWDSTNKRVNILRDGRYMIQIGARPKDVPTSGHYYGIRCYDGTTEYATILLRAPSASSVIGTRASELRYLVGGTYLEFQYITETGGIGVDVTQEGDTQDGATCWMVSELGGGLT